MCVMPETLETGVTRETSVTPETSVILVTFFASHNPPLPRGILENAGLAGFWKILGVTRCYSERYNPQNRSTPGFEGDVTVVSDVSL
ncbi:hypothetical protein SAMN02746089_02656 [Caldanaerobius fijiensis DSM 17918]|uniref:Uncharacterized protein n=1 Tax=Caldanaerobius fijiensis DSM 17918 TaxID=1121256 RepID=A0A1M5F0R6_9THEO|nr:hypothetical protein SAMN02746089_02656 [Caldanaerobius fijiensis DSM 17918]